MAVTETKGIVESLLLQLQQAQDHSASLFAQLEKANKQIEGLTAQVIVMAEELAMLRKSVFGSRSEKTPASTAKEQDEAADEPPVPLVKKEKMKKKPPVKTKGRKAERIKNLEATEIVIPLAAEAMSCSLCGGDMKKMGPKVIREVVEYKPAGLYRIVYVEESAYCDCQGADSPTHVVSSQAPAPLIQGAFVGPGLLARIFQMKFALSVPVYRQIPEWKKMGIDLNRNMVSNWIIVGARDWLAPIYERFHRELVSRDVLHADETPYQILQRDDGRPATSQARVWIARTTWQAEKPVVYYHAALTRATAEAKKLLSGFSGYLHCDAYSVYFNLEGVVVCACLAHIRRKFLDVSAAEGTGYAAKAVAYCDEIFKIEREKLKELDPERRKEQRQKLVKPVLEEFYEWLTTFTPMKGNLQTAVNYVLKLKEEAMRFLEDGRLQASNNLCEQMVKPVALGRKNYLFSNSMDGAVANAMGYTLIETAKANGLDSEKYLAHLFRTLPETEFQRNPELLDRFLPWDEEMQRQFKKTSL